MEVPLCHQTLQKASIIDWFQSLVTKLLISISLLDIDIEIKPR